MNLNRACTLLGAAIVASASFTALGQQVDKK